MTPLRAPLLPDTLEPARAAYALVVDDHPLVARGLTEFLQLHPDIPEARCAGTAEEALRMVVREGAPMLALVDFWLAEGSTANFIRDLQAIAPGTRVLMVSGDSHPAIALKAEASGAQGFVGKQQSPEVFQAAVAAVLSGGTWFEAAQAEPSVHATREVPLSPSDLGLTARQGQILALMLDGQPNKVIAQALNISEHTVKEHVTALLGRLGVRNRVEAIAKLRGVRLEQPL